MRAIQQLALVVAAFAWVASAGAAQKGKVQDEDSVYSWGHWASMIQPAAGPAPVEPTPSDLEKVGYNLRPEHAGLLEPQPLPPAGGPPGDGPGERPPLPGEDPTLPIEPPPVAGPVEPLPGVGPGDPTQPGSPGVPNPPPPPGGVPPESTVPLPGVGPGSPSGGVTPGVPNPPPPGAT